MKGASERREILAQRLVKMRGLITRMDALDDETIQSSLDSVVRAHLSYGRIRPRLVMRRGRRIAPELLFAPARDAREQVFLSGGSDLIGILSHAVGVHILWQDVIRLVHRSDVVSLDAELGIASRDIALAARVKSIGVTPRNLSAEKSINLAKADLALRVKREGALSWACWLAACEPARARRLRVFTPDAVSSEVLGGIPDDPDQRNLRRLVVEFEMDQYLERAQAEAAEGETE